MKRLLLFPFLFVITTQAGFNPPATHPGIYTLDSGNVSAAGAGDIIDAIADPSLQRGDTILIPSGNWTWGAQVRVNKGFNINIIGDTTRPVITRGTFNGYQLYITVSNSTPKTTFRVSNIAFEGPGSELDVDGIGTISVTGGVYTGGMRIDHCRFAQPYYNDSGFTVPGCSTNAAGTQIDSHGNKNFSTADVNRWVYFPTCTAYYPQVKSIVSPTVVALDIPINPNLTSTAISFTGQATGQENGQAYRFNGWVFGVFDHNESDGNMQRIMSKNADVRQNTSPTGTGRWGDASACYIPAGRQDMAGWYDAFVFEDNIFHRGTGAFSDCDLGGIMIARHNTTFASFASHGTRETGGRGHGMMLMEYYNNMFCLLIDRMETHSSSTNAIESRDGEQIAFNNTIQVQQGGNFGYNFVQTVLVPDTCAAVSMDCHGAGSNGYYFGADGLNPLDNNAKADASGNYKDPNNGITYHVATAYNPPPVTDQPSFLITTTDTVSGGIDSNALYSDVFGVVSGGSSSPNTLTNVTVTGVNFPTPTVPANYFKGFVIRNSTMPRYCSGLPSFPFTYILTSTSGASTGTVASSINMTVMTANPCVGGTPPTFVYSPSNNRMELRRVKEYFGMSGRGALSIPIVDDSSPMTYNTSTTPNPRWIPMIAGGSWSWGNIRRKGTGPNDYYNDEFPDQKYNPTTGSLVYILGPNVHRVQGPSQNSNSASNSADPRPVVNPNQSAVNPNGVPCGGAGQPVCSAIEPLFARGYKWDPTVAAGSPKTRIGADWTKTFNDPQTGLPVFSNDPAVTTGGPNGNGWPEFVSYYRTGVGGDTLPYPHPLIAAPSPSPPTITSKNNTTFTASQPTPGETFTFTTLGIPTPTFTPIPSNWPTGVTMTDNGDGTAKLVGINIPVPAPGATPWHDTITVRNNGGPGGSVATATQAFSLTIQAPITVSLDKPDEGTQYTAPATIPMSASITGGGGTVDFYDGTSSVGSDSTADATGAYTFNYSTSVIGSHDLHAKVGTVDSNHRTVTVVPPPPTPTPAQILVHP